VSLPKKSSETPAVRGCATFFRGTPDDRCPPTTFSNRDFLIIEGILQEYICALLKNGPFSRFYCSFGVFLGVERAHSCAK
jgi:hypothetical protein